MVLEVREGNRKRQHKTTKTIDDNKKRREVSMIMKVFTQPSCPKCLAEKKVVAQVEDKFAVEQYDIKTEDGLTEALEYDVMSTPSIVIIEKNKVVAEWRGQSPTVEELLKAHK